METLYEQIKIPLVGCKSAIDMSTTDTRHKKSKLNISLCMQF